MTDLSTLKWFLVCCLGPTAEIKILKRYDLKTEAIAYMKENDNGTYFILEALS